MSTETLPLRSKTAVSLLPNARGKYTDSFVSPKGVVEIRRGFAGHLNLHVGRTMLQISGLVFPGVSNDFRQPLGVPMNTYVVLNPFAATSTSFNDALRLVDNNPRDWGDGEDMRQFSTEGARTYGPSGLLISGDVKGLLGLPDEAPNLLFEVDTRRRNLHISAHDIDTALAARMRLVLELPNGLQPQRPRQS